MGRQLDAIWQRWFRLRAGKQHGEADAYEDIWGGALHVPRAPVGRVRLWLHAV